MNKISGSIILLLIVLQINNSYSQDYRKYSQQSATLVDMLDKLHCQALKVDDSLSEKVFTLLLNDLDPERLYFTNTELDTLEYYKYRLDEEINRKLSGFLRYIIPLYKERLLFADSIIDQVLNQPFDFSVKEKYAIPKTSRFDFAVNDSDLRDRWYLFLKYSCMHKMISTPTMEDDSNLSDKVLILSREEEMRKRVKLKARRRISQILESPMGFENDVAHSFLNAIASSYDPHSLYFSAQDLDSFEGSMATEAFSFGFEYDENDEGEIVISRLVPGGPAWKSNEIHKGDALQQIKTESKTIDLSYSDRREIYEILSSLDHTPIELTVRKTNGFMKTVSLKKEKIRKDENSIKSFVLKGEKNIGYISLPGFYSESDDQTAIGCSHDIARSIMKMKYDDMDGLILDLRFNGGGNMKEALDLTGIFIDEGPLAIHKIRDTRPMAMKDMNRGTIYDGPLVVLINNMSASASELVAAALQDYQRALIVGTHSFGKATSQNILPLSNKISYDYNRGSVKDGFVKITGGKFYRVSGASHQQQGVQPDIYLPDLYETMNFSEAGLPHSLASDSVAKQVGYKVLPKLPIDSLLIKSNKRTGSDPRFQQLVYFNDSVFSKWRKVPESVIIDVDAYAQRYKDRSEWIESIEQLLEQKTKIYQVENLSYDSDLLQMDEYSREINTLLRENIGKDMYVEEAFKIITDLIKLN
ncbi:MAG: carboxy terminal-processing peptidase [Bacteroidales bacterium]|nr:carboxy terminal-processing peptidase [Bacteroidales bacterium]